MKFLTYSNYFYKCYFLRTLTRLRENWTSLPQNKKGEVVRKTGDFSTRKGQCIEPVSVVDLFPFTVTHKV